MYRSHQLLPVAALALAAQIVRADVTLVPPGSLHDAVASSSPGDTLVVSDSAYYIPLTIPHDLTLIAPGGCFISNWSGGVTALPGPTLKIEATGRVVLVGMSIEFGMHTSQGDSAVGAPNLDELVLIDCEVRSVIGPLDGSYYGDHGVLGPDRVYTQGTLVSGGQSISDIFWHAQQGAPAVQTNDLIARESQLLAGGSGENVVTPVGTCGGDLYFSGTCMDFVSGISGTPGQSAVHASNYFGQSTELAPAAGVKYYCCQSPPYCGSYYALCSGSDWAVLGYGPTGEEVDGAQWSLPQNLAGGGRVSIGSSYSLESSAGALGGLIVLAGSLADPQLIEPFGWLMVNLTEPFRLIAQPAGSSTFTFAVPYQTQLIGATVAFQAWDQADAALGVPLLVVIEP